jgi:hypothetical protein
MSRSNAGILVTLATVLAGCAASPPSPQTSYTIGSQSAAKPVVYRFDQLSTVAAGRFCRVNTAIPNTYYEGTIVCVSNDAVEIDDATVVARKSTVLFGHGGSQWSCRLFDGTDFETPAGKIVVPRDRITTIEVYDAADSPGLIEQQINWRAARRRIQDNLATAEEFPNEG